MARKGRQEGCKAVVNLSACYGWCRARLPATKGLTGFRCKIRLEGVPAVGYWPAAGLGRGLLVALSEGPGGRSTRVARVTDWGCALLHSLGRTVVWWNAYGFAAANCGIQAAAANLLLLADEWRSFPRVWAFRGICATQQILPPITTFDGIFMRNDKY